MKFSYFLNNCYKYIDKNNVIIFIFKNIIFAYLNRLGIKS